MTAPTHKQFSICFAFLATMLMYKTKFSQINYYFVLGIMLLVSRYGALFPDIDHNWQNVKEKTVPNWIINKLIHATGGKHRSWQTHSLDIALIVTVASIIMPQVLLDRQKIDEVNYEVMSIILAGFSVGWLSHLFSDMLTSAGIRILCCSKRKLAFVPKKIGRFRFNTGNEWELGIYRVIRLFNITCGAISVVYPYLGNIISKIKEVM